MFNVENLNRELVAKLVFSSVPAFFWVIFLWNFWDKGPYALGFNAVVFFSLLLGLFIWVLRKQTYYTSRDLFWIIPVALIVLSYGLYDNPFLKIINLLVLPVVFAIFYNQAFLPNKEIVLWDTVFVTKIIGRFFSFVKKLGPSVAIYLHLLTPARQGKKHLATRVVGGVILFLVVALTVFIPLLSAADPVFAGKAQFIYAWLSEFVSLPLVYRLLVGVFLSIFFFSVLMAWGRKFELEKGETANQGVDSVVSGIVLGGILVLYLLFLWLQVSRLWVGSLPFDFKEVEGLVKSGFWQLLFLSIINILIYFFTYRKTAPAVQKMLTIFTVTSLLLLASAGYRMGLYVTYYGLSYEKFFASYAVIYCTILFVWLIVQLLTSQRANIFKFLVFLFLWMYAMVTIFPVEWFILRTNIALSGLKDSRVQLIELTMLSPDALSLVKYYHQLGVLQDDAGQPSEITEDEPSQGTIWEQWIASRESDIASKAWYEKNLGNVFHY